MTVGNFSDQYAKIRLKAINQLKEMQIIYSEIPPDMDYSHPVNGATATKLITTVQWCIIILTGDEFPSFDGGETVKDWIDQLMDEVVVVLERCEK